MLMTTPAPQCSWRSDRLISLTSILKTTVLTEEGFCQHSPSSLSRRPLTNMKKSNLPPALKCTCRYATLVEIRALERRRPGNAACDGKSREGKASQQVCACQDFFLSPLTPDVLKMEINIIVNINRGRDTRYEIRDTRHIRNFDFPNLRSSSVLFVLHTSYFVAIMYNVTTSSRVLVTIMVTTYD